MLSYAELGPLVKGFLRMVRKTLVTVFCDLPHDIAVEAAESVPFAFNGYVYEIDLCEPHSADARAMFGELARYARRSAGEQSRRRTSSRIQRQRSAAIREFARQRGLVISERGRIPINIVTEYDADRTTRR